MSETNKYDWKLLTAKLSEEIWRSGDWKYGGDLETPELGPHGHAVGAGRNVSEAGEWWAPCNADGTPRPWPEAAARQAPPKPGVNNVVPLVIADLEARARVGESKYGTPLQTHNGRSAPLDLYQELLDAGCYARQWISEREDLQAQLNAARKRIEELKDVVDEYEALQAQLQDVTDERDKMRAALQTVHELMSALEGDE